MDYNNKEIHNAIEHLSTFYNDINVNNNITIIYNDSDHKQINQEYKYLSMKQSVFKNVDFDSCLFENVACTGSSFENVKFSDTTLIGNSFANCDFLRVNINGNGKNYEANNFSHSSFELCDLNTVKLFRSGMLNSSFHNCKITNTLFRGSTVEGTKFSKCNLTKCDFGRVNVDYTMFVNNTYNDVTFPFYQLAYIIGMADMLENPDNNIFVFVGDDKKSIKEYIQQLNNLKLFYLDKGEIFPVCNICIAQNQRDEAKRFLIQGVENAISTRNFRMISNLCRLACYHGLVDDKIRYKINKAMDQFIQSDTIPESQLNYYLTYIGNIQTMLKEGSSKTVTINYKITTNTCKKDEDGVRYVNKLINDLNTDIAQVDNVDGYNIIISNFSPFEITVGVITIFGVAVEVGKTVWNLISKHRDDKRKKKQEKEDIQKERERFIDAARHNTDVGAKYINSAIDHAKEKILRLQRDYSGKDLDRRIVAVTQSLKTDLEEFYSKQIMYFQLNNANNIK